MEEVEKLKAGDRREEDKRTLRTMNGVVLATRERCQLLKQKKKAGMIKEEAPNGVFLLGLEMDLDNPGPCDSSVLTEQDLHVSSAIWDGEDRGVLKCHEHTKELKMWKLTEAQIKLVEMAGFKHLSMITDMSIDAPSYQPL
ncbi:Protein MAIN-like 1 [Vitis vinifera]|uniref:Protein MAIN-like 1 n=1 Tax=Vitis vinifera TaxID=29760 RepID=A0A438HU06_VITVI|nr:Protein MAIN-like 1 [Vitis vinifera]